jgi:hypothetical protein
MYVPASKPESDLDKRWHELAPRWPAQMLINYWEPPYPSYKYVNKVQLYTDPYQHTPSWWQNITCLYTGDI